MFPIMKPKYSRLRDEKLYGSSVNNVYIIKNTFIVLIIDKVYKKLVLRNWCCDKVYDKIAKPAQ